MGSDFGSTIGHWTGLNLGSEPLWVIMVKSQILPLFHQLRKNFWGWNLENYCSGQVGANQGSRQSATTLPFFTQSMLFNFALPKAAQLSIFFVGKLVVLHLLEGPELRTHYWEDREEKKAQHPAGFEPTTSLLRGVLSTAVPQPLPFLFEVSTSFTEASFF